MTLKNQDQEIGKLGIRFLAHKYNVYNPIKRVYQRKLIVYGDNYILYSYPEPKATFVSSKKHKPKPMKTERDKTSFWRAKQNLIRLIACNTGSSAEKPTFWTFTFDPKKCENIQDLKSANYYFKIFRQQLTRKLGYKPKYIAVPEFQKNGNVHYHVIFFNLPFIATDIGAYKKTPSLLKKKVYDFTMNDIWTYGFTHVILLNKVRNVSLYLIKYMSKSFNSNTGNKTYGEKLYFSSKGLERPKEYYDRAEIYPELKKYKLEIISEYKNKYNGLIIKRLKRKT